MYCTPQEKFTYSLAGFRTVRKFEHLRFFRRHEAVSRFKLKKHMKVEEGALGDSAAYQAYQTYQAYQFI